MSIWFPFKKYFLEEITYKKVQFRTILFPYKNSEKVYYWKENISKNSLIMLYALSSCQYPLINYPALNATILMQKKHLRFD